MQTDTLTYNAQMVANWKESGDFDYNRELVGSQMNLMEWLMRQLSSFIDQLFSGVTTDVKTTLYIIGGLLIMLLAVWLIYKKRPNLFRREEKSSLDFEEVKDTIYGIDFDKQISEAKQRGDWFEAVRLIYLDTLKFLSDKGDIVWQPWKTPMEYTREVNDDALRRMTRQFVLVRYGNFVANEDNVVAMEQWQRALKPLNAAQEKGGSDE